MTQAGRPCQGTVGLSATVQGFFAEIGYQSESHSVHPSVFYPKISFMNPDGPGGWRWLSLMRSDSAKPGRVAVPAPSAKEHSPEIKELSMDGMKALAAEYRKKLQDEEQRKAEEERLKTLPLQEWNELRQMMRVKMVAFNSHMQEVILSWDSDDADQVLITRKSDGRALAGSFDESEYSLHFECVPAQIDLQCVIGVQAKEAVYLPNNGHADKKLSLTRDGITTNLLRELLIN